MRNLLFLLGLAVAAILAFTVLLPVLGLILVLVAGFLIVGVGLFLAAPLLAKLPWFRKHITIYRSGGGQTIHFGRGHFTSYYSDMTRPQPPGADGVDEADDPPLTRRPPGQLGNGEIIDVEGREVPDDEHKE